jgi:hypothetical protein
VPVANQPRRVAVRNVGGMDDDAQQKAERMAWCGELAGAAADRAEQQAPGIAAEAGAVEIGLDAVRASARSAPGEPTIDCVHQRALSSGGLRGWSR